MAFTTVLQDDFRNARRSRVVVAVVGVFAALAAIMFVSESSIHADGYRTLFDLSFLTAVLLPLFVAPLTYLAVAGDRASGAIKYAVGLPNSRTEYVLAKWVSRAGVAVAAPVVATAVGFIVALATFAATPDPVRFLTFAAVSALYALAMTGVFLAISTLTASRSRAMFGVIGAFFLLVPFWFGLVPVVQVTTLLDFAETLFGITIDERTRATIRALSPTTAYLEATEPVYDGVVGEYERISGTFGSESDALANELWFN
ncbi:MAG: ABC transporter permease, partial [Halobaculum sp.]